jgi:hypothetical protein
MSSLYGFGWPNGQQYTNSFNFTDLYIQPVPDSIYEMQPRCGASTARAKRGRYRPLPSDYPGCARTAPYEPIIVIPLEIRSLDPAWASCNGGIRGVYDPPCKSSLGYLVLSLQLTRSSGPTSKYCDSQAYGSSRGGSYDYGGTSTDPNI